jgi:hypothetical protein
MNSRKKMMNHLGTKQVNSRHCIAVSDDGRVALAVRAAIDNAQALVTHKLDKGTLEYITETANLMAYLHSHSDVKVDVVQPRHRDIFHDVRIDGQRFIGATWASEGVCLCQSTTSGGVLLREEVTIEGFKGKGNELSWWLCRYGEKQMSLECLTMGGLHALGHQFGIVVHPHFDGVEDIQAWKALGYEWLRANWYAFYLSPAFESLKSWAQKHPRKIRNMREGRAVAAGGYVFEDRTSIFLPPSRHAFLVSGSDASQ